MFINNIYKLFRFSFLLFFLCFIHANVFSQSVYSLNLKKDLLIGAVSLGISSASFFINNVPDYVPGTLSKNDLNSFDRSLVFSYNKPLDLASDNGVYGLILLPFFSLMPKIRDKNAVLTYSVMYGEALLLTYGTVFTLKRSIVRYRPYMYSGGIPCGKENDYFNSFPSSAVSFAFLSAAFFSVTFSQEYPESKWKLPVIIGSYALAAGTASMRILAGSHFLSDVLAGAAIGSLYGGLIPNLHKKTVRNGLTMIPDINGIKVSLRY